MGRGREGGEEGGRRMRWRSSRQKEKQPDLRTAKAGKEAEGEV